MGLTNTLQSHLKQQIEDANDQAVAHSIFGTAEVDAISDLLNRYCQAAFNQAIAACTFAYISVGATVVVQLTDSTKAVLKAYGQRHDPKALTASFSLQKLLAETGFPCPEVLQLPQPFDTTLLTAQTFCDPGERVKPNTANIRQTMARYLARLIRQTKSYPHHDLPTWMATEQGQLWHQPHSIRFDFEKTAAGAEWIDQIAHQAKQILRVATGPPVIGHSDWSLQNMSFSQGKLTHVYDWDALRIGLEPCLVGGAARCYRHDWRYGPPETAISVAEVQDFIETYQQERGEPFSVEEQRILGAALVYTAAYGLRCAHAIKQPEDNHSEDNHYENSTRQLLQFTNYFLNF